MSKPITFDRMCRIVITLVIAAGCIWLVNILRNVLLPFCLACLIAYMLQPVVEFCMKRLKIRWHIAAIFLTLGVVGGAIVGLAYLFIPSIIDETTQMITLVKRYTDTGDVLPLFPKEVWETVERYLNADSMTRLLAGGKLESILSKSLTLVSTSVEYLFHVLEWLLTFIYVIFILLDYRDLMKGFQMLVPKKYRPISMKLSEDIKLSMNRYFRGQAFLALCAAIFYCIGFSIVGIPMAIVLGILVGVLYMIPYFQYVTLVPVAFVCFISSLGGPESFWIIFGKCLLVYLVSQSVCDYILTPKIMGKALGLNPALILLSLSVWGTLLGLIGMIIALPLTTLLLAYYQEYVVGDEAASAHLPGIVSLPKKPSRKPGGK